VNFGSAFQRWIMLPAVCSCALPAAADELRVAASASTQLEYNDNPNLTADSSGEVAGLVADVGMEASWAEESWRFYVEPHVIARRYTGENELDSRDLRLATGFTHALERSKYVLSAAYAREYTLTSQFAATGTIDENIPRESLTGQAAIEHALNERVDIGSRVLAEDVRYINGLRYGLFDYRYALISLSAGYGLSEQTRVNLVSRFARLDVEVTGSKSREFSAGLGVDHSWSERWNMSLSVGPTWSEINGRNQGAGVSYLASLAGAFERSEVAITAEYLLSPDAAQGRLQTREALNASLVHRLRHSLNATAFVRGERYSDVGDRAVLHQDDYGTVSAGASLEWRPREAWGWRMGYVHTLREGDGTPQSNSLTAGVVWNGRPRSMSL
jgi:hypothetical protein